MEHIFNKFNEIHQSNMKLMKPLISIQNNLNNSMLNYNLGLSSELLKIGKTFNNSTFKVIPEQQVKLANSVLKTFQENNGHLLQILQPLANFQNTINKFSNVFKGIPNNLLKGFEELPEKLQSAIMILANEGWFVSHDISLALLLKANNTKIDKIEEILILYYEEKLDLIKERLMEKFPNRASIFSKAFYAHKNEMYELSIPIFLIQADGICLDLINRNFFGEKNNKGYFEDYIKLNASSIIAEEFLKPLKEKIPLVQNKNQRSENFNKLNRHLILHGECTDYANKINSLKSILFISYLLDVLVKTKDLTTNEI